MVGFVGRLVGLAMSVGLVRLVAVLLRASLPVPNVDLLCGDAEFVEVLRLWDIDQGVLDPVGKTLVVSMTERCVSPSCQSCKFVKLDIILSDLMFITHSEGVKTLLRVSDGVRRSEVDSEFSYELVPVNHPDFLKAKVQTILRWFLSDETKHS